MASSSIVGAKQIDVVAEPQLALSSSSVPAPANAKRGGHKLIAVGTDSRRAQVAFRVS